MMKHWLWILLISLTYNSLAGELVLSGEYKGKDLFVQNPFNRSTQSFCTQEVYVNDIKVLDNPKVSAFKIDLSHLSPNDLVVVRITFVDDCQPSIINPHVLHPNATFEFVSIQADNNSISWVTMGELPGGSFFIEQVQEDGGWKDITEKTAKGKPTNNAYSIPASHIKGENGYRIRYINTHGEITYSLETFYTSTSNPITFFPEVATSQLTFSDSTSYEITDYFGKTVKKGSGHEVLVLDLKPGEYYLLIQNRKEKFIKK